MDKLLTEEKGGRKECQDSMLLNITIRKAWTSKHAKSNSVALCTTHPSSQFMYLLVLTYLAILSVCTNFVIYISLIDTFLLR